MTSERAGLPPYRYERPIANEYGRLRSVGDRLVCHLCGRDWLLLGTHVWLTHGMTADEYRAALLKGSPMGWILGQELERASSASMPSVQSG